ncbi:hypothetical protein AVEN_64759-1 [Araneus ventricosus]|uniref:Uncharacterized protein n=1 Tax=Araneus ventricosus TaxID=182803 RepID=A0A4Y2VLP8_ARAVE|nr:hypothetical protein AVEN_64759-1 [Araneus ventricosus]
MKRPYREHLYCYKHGASFQQCKFYGWEVDKVKHGVISRPLCSPDLSDKLGDLITIDSRKATLFDIYQGKYTGTPCDVIACRREYLRTAPRPGGAALSTGIVLEHECPFGVLFPQCELMS